LATSARGVDFSALVNAQNSNTTYNAGGVLPLTRQQISLQGSLEQSRSTTDLAISGDGFFIVSTNNQQLSNGGSVLFTRAGSFTIDAEGYMVNAQGLFLQGWPVAATAASPLRRLHSRRSSRSTSPASAAWPNRRAMSASTRT
jgi:flagellar hook protein FlgE